MSEAPAPDDVFGDESTGEQAVEQGPDPSPDPAPDPDPEPHTEKSTVEKLTDNLMSTEPAKSLDQLDREGLWNPEQGGASRIQRGLLKFSPADSFDGIPAIGDIILGAVELWSQQADLDIDPGSGESTDLPTDVEIQGDLE